MDTKKKLTYAIVAVVLLMGAWMGYGMISGESEPEVKMVQTNPDIPKPATVKTAQMQMAQQPVVVAAPMTEREMQLMKLQQDMQTKYLAAINELQMLKVEKDIAETNKDISKAKLDSITAQKDIVELLSPKVMVAPDSYVKGLDQSASTTTTTPGDNTLQPQIAAPSTPSVGYTVISVSRLRGEWNAVIGASGKLYSVKAGDVLAADGSVVLGINRSGVLLEKDGKRTKVSMVPVI